MYDVPNLPRNFTKVWCTNWIQALHLFHHNSGPMMQTAAPNTTTQCMCRVPRKPAQKRPESQPFSLDLNSWFWVSAEREGASQSQWHFSPYPDEGSKGIGITLYSRILYTLYIYHYPIPWVKCDCGEGASQVAGLEPVEPIQICQCHYPGPHGWGPTFVHEFSARLQVIDNVYGTSV